MRSTASDLLKICLILLLVVNFFINFFFIYFYSFSFFFLVNGVNQNALSTNPVSLNKRPTNTLTPSIPMLYPPPPPQILYVCFNQLIPSQSPPVNNYFPFPSKDITHQQNPSQPKSMNVQAYSQMNMIGHQQITIPQQIFPSVPLLNVNSPPPFPSGYQFSSPLILENSLKVAKGICCYCMRPSILPEGFIRKCNLCNRIFSLNAETNLFIEQNSQQNNQITNFPKINLEDDIDDINEENKEQNKREEKRREEERMIKEKNEKKGKEISEGHSQEKLFDRICPECDYSLRLDDKGKVRKCLNCDKEYHLIGIRFEEMNEERREEEIRRKQEWKE
jgi:hypothetical protein